MRSSASLAKREPSKVPIRNSFDDLQEVDENTEGTVAEIVNKIEKKIQKENFDQDFPEIPVAPR